ncbi:hypothetical protein FOPG_20147 [Fusarium oxysporum f. sp. conglutinans race 2 54008]|uniref:Uncharacterized protein n=1 Tax=Fusarium oxysporum f. sp. conglutinans race 2 54008 TaxID=1089457 RepID=X0HQR6_FUSOX|nr:hypothetical protein FOPG_20147 [Fusarium oxysporum f. sp. conglutinans race 2 54008]
MSTFSSALQRTRPIGGSSMRLKSSTLAASTTWSMSLLPSRAYPEAVPGKSLLPTTSTDALQSRSAGLFSLITSSRFQLHAQHSRIPPRAAMSIYSASAPSKMRQPYTARRCTAL